MPGSTIRHSISGDTMPWLERTSASSSSERSAIVLLIRQTEPSGLVSVIPQACRIGWPSFSR